MAGLLVNCIDVARTIVSVYTSRVREPRGASHTQLRQLRRRQPTDSTTNARIMQHAMAQGLRNPCPWPAQLGQLGSADASARCPAASTILSTSTVAVPVVDHRCGQRAQHSNRGGKLGKELPEAAATKAGCSSRPERRAAAARHSADFEAALRLRGSSVAASFAPLRVAASAGYVAPRRPNSMQPPWGTVPHGRGRNRSVWGRCCCVAAL